MSNVQSQIADLEAQRTALYAGAAGRHLTAIERERLRMISRALSAAWELRRIEQAQNEPIEHELIIRGTGDWRLEAPKAVSKRDESCFEIAPPGSSPQPLVSREKERTV